MNPYQKLFIGGLLLVTGILCIAIAFAGAAGPNVGPAGTITFTEGNTNADGTPLTDLAGFDLIIGPQPGVCPAAGPCPSATAKVVVDGMGGVPAAPTVPTVGSIPVTTAVPSQGQNYLCVRAFDTTGNRSGCSNEFAFVFDSVPPGAPSGTGVK